MTAPPRLTDLDGLPPAVARPGYDRARHGAGIVHIGVGAFFRAHQAVYTDAALAAAGGDWCTVGLAHRGTGVADALIPQNGLFTVLVRGGAGTSAQVVGALTEIVAAARAPERARAVLADPATRIVSLTVTEKAYGIVRSGGIDPAHPAIVADLARPDWPTGVIGLLVEGLRRRRAAGIAPFTVLCCDNLPDNGVLLRAGAIAFADRVDGDLAGWIAREVAFPSTMVDRITPASTAATLADAAAAAGRTDLAAVETEPFSHWVIEDRFPTGRPAWEAGGALFVEAVAPFERMKLRMVNGTHSMLAYAGFLSGRRYVRDVLADPALAALVARHLAAAGATLEPLPGIDLAAYSRDLVDRLRNPAIAHETYQIAMDGTEKLPPRLFAPALELLARQGDIRPFAFATAVWMRYCLGRTDAGERYALRDPRQEEIARRLDGQSTAAAIVAALQGLPGWMPERLAADPTWTAAVTGILAALLADGVAETLRREAAGPV